MTVAFLGGCAADRDRLASTRKRARDWPWGLLALGLFPPRNQQAEEEEQQEGLVLIAKGDGASATQWGLGRHRGFLRCHPGLPQGKTEAPQFMQDRFRTRTRIL